MSFFTANIEFVLRLKSQTHTGLGYRPVNFSLSINSFSRAVVYFDEEVVYEVAKNTRQIKTVQCNASEVYNETEPITNNVHSTGCCFGVNGARLLNFTRKMHLDDRDQSYVRIVYMHEDSSYDGRYTQEPCVKLFKESIITDSAVFGNSNPVAVIPFSEVTVNESYALTELHGSPFQVQAVLDPSLVDTHEHLVIT